MTLLTQEITARVLTLEEQEQQEALDFIEFLQSKAVRKLSGRGKYPNSSGALLRALEIQPERGDEKDVSSIYQLFEQAGLIGCIETDEQLSTTYKEKLDFSFKHGATR